MLLALSDALMVRAQSATTAWQQAFFGLQFRQGDRILTSVQEYATNYINFLQVARPESLQIPTAMRATRLSEP